MKKTTTLSLLLCSTICMAQTHLDIKVPYRLEVDLLGPVQSTHTEYQKENHKSSGTEYSSWARTMEYDELGNLLTASYTNHNSGKSDQTVYDYDENGCLTGRTYQTPQTNRTYSYSFDFDARQMLRLNQDSGHLLITAYNTNGYHIYTEEQDESNTVTRIVKLKRLPNNKEYEYATFKGDLTPQSTTHYKWNTHGLLRERSYISHSTNSQYSSLYQYSHPEKDDIGNWTRRITRRYQTEDGKKKLSSEEIAERTIEYFSQTNLPAEIRSTCY